MKEKSKAIASKRVQVFRAEYDEEGVYFYQAFKDEIADWAIENQCLGGPYFQRTRMTWIKPSFAWMLFRSRYGKKTNQKRILKIKVGHDALAATLLSRCTCSHGHGGTPGRVQWDPERDIMTSDDGREPRKMSHTRAIQIGFSKDLSELYVQSILSIEDVTELAHRVGKAHQVIAKDPKSDVMQNLLPDLPTERPYMPHMDDEGLRNLALLPGKTADEPKV